MNEPHELTAGQLVASRYRVERIVDRGGMGVVYEAVEELRRVRRTQDADEWLELSTADPLNLNVVVGDSARTFAPARKLVFRNGAVVSAESAPRHLAARESASVRWRQSLRR